MALKAEKQRIQLELKRRVQDESERLYVLRPPSAQSTRSAVWQTTHFVHHRGDEPSRRVTFQAQDRVNEFVACVRCKTVWAHSPTSGTKTLKQHKCPGLLIVAADTGAVSPTATGSAQIHEQASHARPSLDDRDRVTDALTDFCAQDVLPFSTVAGQGFMNMIQTVLDVAAKYNKRLVVDDVVTCLPTDVRENVAMRARSGRAALQRKLHTHLSTGVYTACSLDMWSDDAKQIAYLSITIHYITDGFELVDRTLHVKSLRDVSSTMITEELFDGLASFGLDQFNKEQFTVISDSSLTGTTRSTLYEWHRSVVHDIASCLTAAFIKNTHSSSTADNDQHDQQYERRCTPIYRYYANAPALFDLIDDCKDLVAYFELANLQQRLSKPLVQANATCWRSLLQCLTSVEGMRSEILSVLVDKKKTVKVARIKDDLLRELIAFLSEFRIVTLALEKRSVPTIHEVVYWRHRLLAHLRINEEEEEVAATVGGRDDGAVTVDSEPTRALKRILKPTIEGFFVLEPIHVVAALLDPAQKHRARKFGVSDAQIENGCRQLKKHMKTIGLASGSDTRDASACFLVRPLVKKQRVEPRRVAASQYSDDEEEDINDSDDTTDDDRRRGDADKPAIFLNAQVEVEFEKYMSYVVSKSERQAMSELSLKGKDLAAKNRPMESGFPLLTWWQRVGSSEFPILTRVARSILCIPASSSAQAIVIDGEDEDETMAAKCARLALPSVNDLMFLRSSRELHT